MKTGIIIQSVSVVVALMAAPFSEVLAAEIKAQTVEFYVAATPPSPWRQQIADKNGRSVKIYPTKRIKGYLYQSKSVGPGIILAPGCLGVKEFHHTWARRLTDWGYTALIVDSARSRGLDQNCAGEHLLGFREAGLDRRVYDLFGGHDYLTTSEGINPKHIAIMGWGHTDVLAAVLETGVQRFFKVGFTAAVAYYPPCRTVPTGRFVSPVLVLIGAEDDWSSARACEKMKDEGAGGPSAIKLITYPDAFHGFDDPAIKDIAVHPQVWNPNKVPNKGATLLYNERASSDSRKRVKAFLEQKF
ncbi:MAG: dienelactone hydrolase family protein [Rhodospirillales bacterium]|nr:dienelactone hydrolase family protein [Rhodospirillales bacterium]